MPSNPEANASAVELSGAGLPAFDLATIRGWLLLFAIALAPHILLSVAILAHSWPILAVPEFAGVERLRALTQAVILVGHTAGLALILTRNRYAPAYFTLYLPLLLLLFLADPDTVATQVAHSERLGLSVAAERARSTAQAGIRTVLAVAATAAAFGYWLRSKRVQAVFGSTGLGALWRAKSADAGSV